MTSILPRSLSRIGAFSRRLGAQAAMSAIVMTGLHVASVNGYDLRQWVLPEEPAAAVSGTPASPEPRVVGVPARFDLPVEAGGAIVRLTEQPAVTAEPGAAVTAAPERTAAKTAVPSPAPSRVAVPSPRPHPAAPRPVTVAMREAPEALPFDVSMRDDGRRGDGGPAELLAVDEAVPAPPESARSRFRLGAIVPSGAAILQGAGEFTGSAAGVVSGAASRVIDLVR